MKPNDMFLGTLELFSVLMPGFLVVKVGAHFAGIEKLSSPSTADWILVAIASYIVGHVCFAVGAYWDKLDQWFEYKKATELFKVVNDIRRDLKETHFDIISGYKWCQAVLSKLHREAFADVLRKEADSKLFRSLIIPVLLVSLYLMSAPRYLWPGIALGLSAIVVFIRYRDQRGKASVAACTYVITLHQLGKLQGGVAVKVPSTIARSRDDAHVMNRPGSGEN